MGRRRLELFGEDHNIRPGWVTLGASLTSSNWNKEAFAENIREHGLLVPLTEEIESLRPKSPTELRREAAEAAAKGLPPPVRLGPV
jgi:mRNA m6A methyltransferase non-catalytic subunit